MTIRLKEAAGDPQLRGAPLAVYVHLVHELDDVAFRPVKLVRVACELHMKDVTVGWALRRLVAAGYLERGARCPGNRIRTYRLASDAARELAS